MYGFTGMMSAERLAGATGFFGHMKELTGLLELPV